MKKWYTNTTYYLETSVIDDNGDFVTGLSLSYEVRKSSDNSLFASGVLTSEGNVYKASIIFTSIGQYRVFYTTPSGYENGLDIILAVVPEITDATIYDYFTDGSREDTFKADVSDVATEANATINKDSIIVEVNENETKIDNLQTDISGLETVLNKVLGLAQSNYRIFSPVYDSDNHLLSATIKIYNNSTDCDADINAITSYAMLSTYDGDGNMLTYKVVEN